MTRYGELVRAQSAALHRLAEYHNLCVKFAEQFFDGMLQYFKCPEENLKFFSIEDTVKESTMVEALYLQDDGYYSINFAFIVQSPGFEDSIVLPLRFKKLSDKSILRIGRIRREFEIAEGETPTPVYEHLFTEIRNFYDNDGYIIKKTNNPIGFITRNTPSGKEIIS